MKSNKSKSTKQERVQNNTQITISHSYCYFHLWNTYFLYQSLFPLAYRGIYKLSNQYSKRSIDSLWEIQGLSGAIRIHRSLLSPLFHSDALAVAKPFSGFFFFLDSSRIDLMKRPL